MKSEQRKDQAAKNRRQFASRRAGLRSDERDPDEPAGPPGCATGGIHAAGAPAGGGAAGGLAGSNTPDGEPIDSEIEDVLGSSAEDTSGDEVEGGPPYAGPAGGAVGGTPAEKRAKGGHPSPHVPPATTSGADNTIGIDPLREVK